MGDPAVGKTTIRKKYLGETTTKDYVSTIGSDFATKKLHLSDKLEIQYQIFDLAGQPRFDKVRSTFYEGAILGLLVYDITNKKSLENLPKWVDEALKNSRSFETFAVVGNKIDLKDQKKTNKKERDEFIKDLSKQMEEDIFSIYTSALTGENIDLLFDEVTKLLLDRVGKENPKIKQQIEAALQNIEFKTEERKHKEEKPKKKEKPKEPKTMEERVDKLENEVAELQKTIRDLSSELAFTKNILQKYLREKQKLISELHSMASEEK